MSVRKRVDSEAAVRKQAAEEAAKRKAKEDKEHGAAAEKEPELPTEPNNREKMLTNLKGDRLHAISMWRTADETRDAGLTLERADRVHVSTN